MLNPLDGLKVTPEYNEENKAKSMQSNFYLVAVPSFFKTSSGTIFAVHQLTSNYQVDYNSPNNILMFSYELSPISVIFTQEKENFIEFMVHICAIIGGIFTIAGIIDAMIYRSVSVLFK